MDESSAALPPGAVFHGRYRIVRPIKTGGMGEVYEALDLRTNSPRALKVMLSATIDGPEQRARFEQEAQVTGSIDSEHVVRISDAGVDAERPFLVMELLRGEELQAILDRSKALPWGEALLYLGQVARALEKTHAQRIVHRDLKPENLFVSRRDDGSACVKILDFGISKIAAAADAKRTRSVGTPLFMAPEQVLGEGSIGPSADLYALAHVAYCLLAGEAYWLEEASAYDTIVPLLKKVLDGPVEPPTARAMRRRRVQIPASFDAWFFRAAAVNPSLRFPSAGAQIEALRDLLLAPASTTSLAVSPAAASVVLPAAANPVSASAATTGPATPFGRATPPAPPAPPYAMPSGGVIATTNDQPAIRSNAPSGAGRTGLVIAGVGALLLVAGLGVGIGIAVSKGSPTTSASASPSASISDAPPTRPSSVDLVFVESTAPAPPPTFALSYCPPSAKCAELRVTSPEAAPVDDLLAQSIAFAHSVEPSATLVQFSLAKFRTSATLDLTKDESSMGMFAVGKRQLLVSSVRNLLMGTFSDSVSTQASVPSTPCPFKTALDVALTKLAITEIVSAAYMSPGTTPIWLFASPKDYVYVDAKSCALLPAPPF